MELEYKKFMCEIICDLTRHVIKYVRVSINYYVQTIIFKFDYCYPPIVYSLGKSGIAIGQDW